MQYMLYWKELAKDPILKEFRATVEALSPLPSLPLPIGAAGGGAATIFSPRPDESALQFYSQLVRGAKEAVFFTAAFGVGKAMAEGLLHAPPGAYKAGYDIASGASHDVHTYLLLENPGRGKDSPLFVEAVEALPYGSVAIGSHLDIASTGS